MRQLVIDYFKNILGDSDIIAIQSYEKLAKYEDILEEFVYWINHKEFYNKKDVVCVEGFHAKQLSEGYGLEPIGAYNYLVFLREKPEEALKLLKENLPIY